MDDFVVDAARTTAACTSTPASPTTRSTVAATTLGGHAWERAGRVWYETARDRGLRSTATFTDFARITVAVAGRLFGAGGAVEAAVRGGWDAVGVAWT